jgi:NAD+ diphosphatase
LMRFDPGFRPVGCQCPAGYYFLSQSGQLLVNLRREQPTVPVVTGTELPVPVSGTVQYLGMLNESPCYAAELAAGTGPMPPGFELVGLRQLYGRLEDDLFWVALRAVHLSYWNRTSRYCGCCGAELQWLPDERGKVCPSCRHLVYPRIAPAVIVAVIRQGKILLARAARFSGNLHSILAGFVEPGETLEECIRREIKEEVGIRVSNLRYFGSQPWPFPDSLMIGFIADYAAGEIQSDGREILSADWFGPENLPPIPDRLSIARRMIDWFVANHQDLTGVFDNPNDSVEVSHS